MATVEMKATTTFKGEPGEGAPPHNRIRRGETFNAMSEARADDYERVGNAVRTTPKGPGRAPTSDQNKAAAEGPTAGPGGKTGEAKRRSSSRQAPAPKPQRATLKAKSTKQPARTSGKSRRR